MVVNPTSNGATPPLGRRTPIPGGRHSPGRHSGCHQQPGLRTPTRDLGHVIPCPNPRPGVRGYQPARVRRRQRPGPRTPTRDLGHVIRCPRPRRSVRGPTGCPRVRARTRPRELAPAALADQPGRLIRPRGIRVAASFPGRGGGCQGSRSRRDAEGALDTRHLDLDNPAAETATPGQPCVYTQQRLRPANRQFVEHGEVAQAPRLVLDRMLRARLGRS